MEKKDYIGIFCFLRPNVYHATNMHFESCIFLFVSSINAIYYMASITSGEKADYDWLRSTFSGPLFSRNYVMHLC